ncbi:hypothetical protein BH10PLA2_BH10PLA2_19280 [soil metagenome]
MGASSGFGTSLTQALPIFPEHGPNDVKCGSGATIGTDLAVTAPQMTCVLEVPREPVVNSPWLAPILQNSQ